MTKLNNKSFGNKSVAIFGGLFLTTIVVGWLALVVAAGIGEVKCIVKAVNCNYDPVGKAEIFYVGGALTGTGAIIGYLDIEDK